MKAMILAAGKGTRLGSITRDRPKPLVSLLGHPMIDWALLKLQAAGIRQVIINTHYLGDQLVSHLSQHPFPGMEISLSAEPELLDTGGGLKRAAPFFHGEEDLLLMNADAISDLSIADLVKAHRSFGPLATLAVRHRPTQRPLLFNEAGLLVSRGFPGEVPEGCSALAFSGYSVLSTRLFAYFPESSTFPLMELLLAAVAGGEAVRAFVHDQDQWTDAGRPETLEIAMEILKSYPPFPEGRDTGS